MISFFGRQNQKVKVRRPAREAITKIAWISHTKPALNAGLILSANHIYTPIFSITFGFIENTKMLKSIKTRLWTAQSFARFHFLHFDVENLFFLENATVKIGQTYVLPWFTAFLP